MDYKKYFYAESSFGDFTDIDGTIIFYTRINSLINSSSVVLDIGCGRGSYMEDNVCIRRNLRILKGKCRKVIGIDLDINASDNPFLDEFRLIDAKEKSWPVEAGSVDLCFCDLVLEHVYNYHLFFSEVHRVLKKNGYICIRTANLLNYIGIISRLIPNKFHSAVLKMSQPDKKEEDTFPTCYRCNTIWKIRSLMNKYGFDHCVYGFESEPYYLSFSAFSYYLGVIYQRFSPKFFKTAIFAFGKKR